MAIDPVLSVTFEALRALSLADATREGRILEARVTAMLSDTMARLSIAGQDIDVTTPQRLPVGAQLMLRAEREGGELRLITQAPIKTPEGATGNAPVAGAAAQQAVDLIEPGRALMAQAQAIAVEAMLGDGSVDQPGASPASTRSQAQPQGQTQAQGQPQAGEAGQTPDAIARGGGDIARQTALRAIEMLLGGRSPGQAELPPILPGAQPGERETALLARLLSGVGDNSRNDTGRLASLLAAEALLGDNTAGDAPLAAAARPQAAPRGTEAPPIAGQQPPETQGKAAPNAVAVASMLSAATDRAQPEARREAAMDAIRAYAAETPGSQMQASQMQAGRHAPLHIEVPVYFPGNPQPLRLQVTREDGEPEEGEGGEKRPRSWTIRFAAEAGSLGMIHAAISMVDGRIGVQLWAENSDTAVSFRQHVAQLQDALEASNLELDALRIQQGAPPVDRSGAERDAGL